MRLRFKFSLKQFLALLTVACVVAYIGSVIWNQSRANEEVNHSRRNIKRIVIALQEYESAYRTLPYSDSGSDAALFALRHLADLVVFESKFRRYGKEPARWDIGSKSLVNGDYSYFNEPGAQLGRSRVVLGCDLDGDRQLYATGDGVVRGRRQPIPMRELLGCWVTVEGFLIADKSTFDEWCATHPIGDRIEETSIEGEPGPIRSKSKDGSSIQYIYVGGRLGGCTVTSANGTTIHYAVETDSYGRIVGVCRSPDK